MGILYLVFAFASFVATPIVNRLGSKYSLFFSSLMYALYISTFILASYRGHHMDSEFWFLNKSLIIFFIYLASGLCGFGGAVLWVA